MNVRSSRIRLFENRWLERLTMVSMPWFLALWAVGLPFIAWRALQSANADSAAPGIVPAALLCFAGLMVWTLTEYALHRFVFHWKPGSAVTRQLVFVVHGNHHAVPNDPLRNLMPPIVSLPVGGLIWVGFVGIAGAAGNWLFLGFMTGYVAYDLVHYACHQWAMKGRLAQMVKTHHLRHHHRNETGNYAITGMMWDRLFRTGIAPRVQAQASN